MNDDAQLVALKIDAVVAEAEALEGFARALKLAEVAGVAFQDFLGEAAEFAEDVKLQLARHGGQFGRAGRIEDDLKLHGASLVLDFQLSIMNCRQPGAGRA